MENPNLIKMLDIIEISLLWKYTRKELIDIYRKDLINQLKDGKICDVTIDPKTGDMRFYSNQKVVNFIPKPNNSDQVWIKDARKLNPKIQIGDNIVNKYNPRQKFIKSVISIMLETTENLLNTKLNIKPLHHTEFYSKTLKTQTPYKGELKCSLPTNA